MQVEEQKPIPKCAYLIKKGEAPAPDRSNIYGWNWLRAKQTDLYEPYLGTLPPLPDQEPRAGSSKLPDDPSEARLLLICGAIDQLEEAEYTQDGYPRVDALSNLLNLEIGKDERDTAWIEYLKRKK